MNLSIYLLYVKNFFYTQIASILVPQKDFYVHNDIEAFLLILLN